MYCIEENLKTMRHEKFYLYLRGRVHLHGAKWHKDFITIVFLRPTFVNCEF